MSYTRVFNDFKRRLLNGEVEPSFNCSAYLMNSEYEQIYDNLQYMRSISDFERMNYDALHANEYGLAGSALASGKVIQNDYYRETSYDEETDFTSDPVFVTSANSATYISYAAGTNKHRNLVMQDYIDTYGGFFLVSKIDEFNKMCSIIEESECERYAVVLADDIENVVVNDSLLNKTRQHPFRGVFDGNGFAMQIQKMFVNDRTCGIFGYIADEGVVRNLIVQPAKIEGASGIDVYSTSQISLDTIKLGQGDVRFGILAGVNEGMCENVVVNADISFYGKWRPNIYFTHNKYVDDSVDEVSLYSPEWQAASSYDVNSISSISSYSNLCFPTQLCINSEANLIPYVGYFGEAAFAHAVEQASKLEKPMYEYPMSGTLGYDGFDIDSNKNTTFCRDIELLYSQNCESYDNSNGHNKDTYSTVHTQRDIMQRGTFRLGPNNRAAYLIGGVFGLNNGCINNVNYSGTMNFNNCTVALIGGIAGRQARGTSHNSIGSLNISTTSGAFADTITVNLPEKTYLTQQVLHATPLSSVVSPNDMIHGSITIYSDDESNTETADCYISPANQYAKRFLPRYQYKSSYIGELSASASNSQSDYSFNACKILSVSTIPVEDEYSPEEIIVNSQAFPDGTVKLKPYSFSLSNAFLRIDSLDTTPQQANLVTNDKNTYMHVDGKTTGDITLVQDTSRMFINLSGQIEGSPTSSVYCTVTADLSATNMSTYVVTAIDDSNTVTKTGECELFNIKLPPLFHVGGYCGEYVLTDRYLRSDKFESDNDVSAYVYNDMQMLYDMSTCGGFASLSNQAKIGDDENDIAARQYGTYNTIAGFAACISVDTMNKSDCDTISSYSYTSATKLHYKYFMNSNFSANLQNDSKLNTVFSTPASFAKYFYYTPDMLPAVIMAASHGRSHSKSKTYEPNFGITWLDQLFYGSGQVEPGSESSDKQSNYAYWMKNDEWTDKYVNTISQAGYSESVEHAAEQNYAYDNKTQLLETFFKFNTDAQAANLTAYSPKQQMPGMLNTPFQYPAGRAGYSQTKYDNANTRESAYSFSTNDEYYNKTTAIAHFDNTVVPANITLKTTAIEEVKPDSNLQSYIFTYSSTTVSDVLSPVKLNLSYASAYSLSDMSNTVESVDFPAFLQKEQTNKCYILTSDSFSSIFSANNHNMPTNFNFVADDNEPLTSNRLVYGFIPTTADIVKCLDTDPLAHLYCSGISATDLQYVLIIDDKYRPIFDIKLDIENVNNQGYSVEFDKAGYHTSDVSNLSYTYSGGMAINIKTGN